MGLSIQVDDVAGERVLNHSQVAIDLIYNQGQHHDKKQDALLRWEGKLRELGLDDALPAS